jgi:proteasome lid subunit RPN8/RPN11
MNHDAGEALAAELPRNVLLAGQANCRRSLDGRRPYVETGGLLVGHFDGTKSVIHELMIDDAASATPSSIEFSGSIFARAGRMTESASPNGLQILGTWHCHPPGFTSYSSTDVTMLFREQMRLRTDDPALAAAPWVHLILRDYGLSSMPPRAFTMTLDAAYSLNKVKNVERQLANRIKKAVENGESLGLGVSGAKIDRPFTLARYHPKTFGQHHNGAAPIVCFWRYFPYKSILHEFEKTFLENFTRKLNDTRFNYLRVLRDDAGKLRLQHFAVERLGPVRNLHDTVLYIELNLEISP